MISVRNVHGKGLGFGKERMGDDTELEEGEAGSYREKTVQLIDPDVAFAYIGEKLHDLLGHHQKEFDGCFTTENLGPIIGAYGSFLPTMKRSSSSVHPMTPQVQVQNNVPKTTTSSLGGSTCFAIHSTTCQKEQHELGSATVSKLPSVSPTMHNSTNKDASFNPTQVSELNTKCQDAKQLPTVAPSNINDSVKRERDASMKSTLVKGINSKSEDANQLTKLTGRKPIRVRITMNSKKLLPRDNAATIYGPGPNTNLLESNTTKGKGVSFESQDIPPKSPNAIIRSVTASLVHGSPILSPLPEYLTYLMINEKEHKDWRTNGSHLMEEDWPDSKSGGKNLKHNKKKPNPRLSQSAEESDRVPQSSMTANQSITNGRSDLHVYERERPGFGTSLLVGPGNEKHSGTNMKCLDSSYKSCVASDTRGPANDGMRFSGLTINDKATSHEQDALKTSSRVPEGGKRSEGCSIQRISLPCLSKGSQNVGSSLKPRNVHRMSGLNNNSKSKNMNLQRDFEKTKDTYKDIFGDLSTDDEESESVYLETSFDCMNKKSEVVYNKKVAVSMHKPKVKESCNNFNECVPIDGCTAVASSASVPLENCHADIYVTAAPTPILENWVLCEDCNKWRLLPLHMDTNSLPDKWTCRMINWLPGMNSCEVSEEDTTQAFYALYESIVPENHLKVDVGLHEYSSRTFTSNIESPWEPFSSIAVPVNMKKKHGSAKMSESIDLKGATKMQQSRTRDFVTGKNRVKMPKFLHDEGVTKDYQRTEKNREGHHGSPQVNGVLHAEIIKAEQDQSTYTDYLLRKHSKTKKNFLEVSAKRTSAKLRVSADDSSLEMQTVEGNHVVNNKRKVRECSESGQLAQVNQAYHEAFKPDDHKRKKRMRLNQSGLTDLISGEGNGRIHEKVVTMNDRLPVKGLGTNPSKLNMHDLHPGKKNLGSLGNIAPESSSSKISSSCKCKIEIEGMKTSLVRSVCSSPQYLPKKDKHTVRRSSLRQDDLVDKPPHKKFEDELLQSADKSNSSCTISVSKEDVSSGEKRRDKKNKVLVNNTIRSCKRDNDAIKSSESSKWTGHGKSVGHEVQAHIVSSEQASSKERVDEGSLYRLLVGNIQLNTESETYKLLSGVVFNGHDDNKIYSSHDGPESRHSIDLRAVSTAVTNDNIVKGPCLVTKSGNQRESQLDCTTPHTQDGRKTTDFGERSISAIRKDLLNEAIFVEKEARSLKYIADRFGESGSACEKVDIYFQSALKFLNAASLYESSCCESARVDEKNHAVQIYRSTIKLLEFCATDFEKLNNLCAAALAYKCMEVACLRVAYSSHSSASKDLHEIQTAVPPGESPSSCFSDVDSLNNMATVDQASSIASPLVAEGLIIPAQNRPNLIQLFTFTEDVDMAMDSSQKSLTAFVAANANPVNTQGISLVKKALDFSFQDVDEFLHLIRSAMEAISGQ